MLLVEITDAPVQRRCNFNRGPADRGWNDIKTYAHHIAPHAALRTDDSDDVRERPRKIRRKICKERRRKTGITQISLRLEWAKDQGGGELQGSDGSPLDGVQPVGKRVSRFEQDGPLSSSEASGPWGDGLKKKMMTDGSEGDWHHRMLSQTKFEIREETP
ncbi:hypothetical protein BGY98DRAFT_1179444 [Russula aff. rugulosa BPL654]|nr:hypothetical protein BGY98DRAFT_1179444 [Russula aff. rugulosa BPL654]